MATRQTAGKSGKRGTAPAGGKPGTGTTSTAKPARGGAGSRAAKPGGAAGSGTAKSGGGAGAGKAKPSGAAPKGGASTSKAARPPAGAPNGRPGRPAGVRAGQSAPPATLSPMSRGLGALGAAWRAAVRWSGRGAGAVGAAWRAAVRWSGGGVPFATMVVSLLGLADSAYLTYQHFSESATFAGCSESGAVNCVAVTTSAWSHVGVFPVSVLGLAFFVFMVVVNSRWGWKAPWSIVHWVRLGSVVVGIVFVLYLIWAELFRINAICLYCTGVHILTFILFALIIGRAAYSGVKAIPDND
jgi:uncharacterized membrane protein